MKSFQPYDHNKIKRREWSTQGIARGYMQLATRPHVSAHTSHCFFAVLSYNQIDAKFEVNTTSNR